MVMGLEALSLTVSFLTLVWIFFYCWVKTLCVLTLTIVAIIEKLWSYYDCSNRT